MERPAAELCRFACQHGQIGHEEVQKRTLPQVINRQSVGKCLFDSFFYRIRQTTYHKGLQLNSSIS